MKRGTRNIIALVLLLAICLIAYIAVCFKRGLDKAISTSMEPVVSNMMANAFAPMRAAMVANKFHRAKNRWPHDKDELAEFAQSMKLTYDSSQFASVSFDPETGPTTTMVTCSATPVGITSTSHLTDVEAMTEEEK